MINYGIILNKGNKAGKSYWRYFFCIFFILTCNSDKLELSFVRKSKNFCGKINYSNYRQFSYVLILANGLSRSLSVYFLCINIDTIQQVGKVSHGRCHGFLCQLWQLNSINLFWEIARDENQECFHRRNSFWKI